MTTSTGNAARLPPGPCRGFPRLKRIARQVVLLLAAAFLIWRVWLHVEVRHRISKLQSTGLPTSGTELEARRARIPDPENGALILTQAFALMRNFPDRRSNDVFKASLRVRTNNWTVTNRALVAEYLHTNAPAFAALRAALVFSRFRYPMIPSNWPVDLPYLRPLRELATAFELRAAFDVETGRLEHWADDIAISLKLALSLEDDPYLDSQVTRRGIIQSAVSATEWCLNRMEPNPGACQMLQAAFARAGQTNPVPLALIGERDNDSDLSPGIYGSRKPGDGSSF